MKRLTLLPLLLILSIVLLQCNPPQRLTFSDKKASSVNRLVIFPVVSLIGTINDKDKVQESLFLSQEAEKQVIKNLKVFLPANITTKYLVLDSATDEQVKEVNINLIKRLHSSPLIRRMPAPAYTLKILDSIEEPYGLFIFHGGFTRTDENYKAEYLKRRSMSLATLGFYNTVPNEAFSIMTGMLVDREQKTIAMYKELNWRNRDPKEEVVIRSQIRDIILTYFNNGD